MAEHIEHEERPGGGVFHLSREGVRVAEMTYRRTGSARVLIDHTFVDPGLRGGGVARQLLDAAVAWARQSGTKLDATCSYVVASFARDESLADVRG